MTAQFPAEEDPQIYWSNAEVPPYPAYGFEEVLAGFVERSSGRKTLLAETEPLAKVLVGPGAPEICQPRLHQAIRDRFRRRSNFCDPRQA